MKLVLFSAVLAICALVIALDYQHPLSRKASGTKQAAEFAALSLPALTQEHNITLQTQAPRWRLVNGWASWCAPCLEEIPDLVALAESLPGLQLVMVAADRTPAPALAQLGRFNALETPILHLWDEAGRTLRAQYGIAKFPESLLISPQGEIVRHYKGRLRAAQLLNIRTHVSATHPPAP